MTFTIDCLTLAHVPTRYFAWFAKKRCTTDPFPRDTALFSTSDTSRPSIGTCWRSGHLDCGLFSGPSTTCLLLVSTRWTAECLQTQWRIGRHAKKSSATTVVCERR